jgi:hypothetical protein
MNSSAGDCCFNALKSSIIYIFLSYRTKCLTLQVCQLVLTPIKAKYMLENTEGQSKMDNPEKLAA